MNIFNFYSQIDYQKQSQNPSFFPKPQIWVRSGLAIALLCSTAKTVRADGIYMTDMRTYLTQESIDLLTDSARSTPGVQDGDIVEFVLEAKVVDDGGSEQGGGPGVYFTSYIQPNVDVLGTSFVTDRTGTTELTTLGLAGLASDGCGIRDCQAPFGAPFESALDARMNDLYGDTGIFYSTNTITELISPNDIAIGPIGDPTNSGPASNGISVNSTFWGNVNAYNVWDANQVNAFGSGGTLGQVPGGSGSNATVINGAGEGSTPFNSGSPIAGADTGYQLDNTGNVGPWSRIQYSGSKISDITDGGATEILTDAPPFTGDSLDASSLGFGLNSNDSVALPSNTNAVRWSYGYGAGGETVYAKVRVRVNDLAIKKGLPGVLLNFTANGSDYEPSGSKDNHWRYFIPTLPESGNFYADKSIVAVDGVPYTGGTIEADSIVTYGVRYLNLGNLPVPNVQIADTLSVHIATTGCDVSNPTITNLSDGVTVGSVPSGNKDCPNGGETLTFDNLPNVEAGYLGALQGGSFTYDIKLADDILDDVTVGNVLTVSGNDVVSSAAVINTATVEFKTPPNSDYGDAPDTYGTDKIAENSSNGSDPVGAKHFIIPELFLGTTVPDIETNGFVDGIDNNNNATDDDESSGSGNGDDEDDFIFPIVTIDDENYTIPLEDIAVTNTTGRVATLHAWIDFDRDGTFGDDEYTSVPVNGATNGGNPTADLFWDKISPKTAGISYARFRLTTDSSIDETTPGGAASDGEVEDYQIAIAPSLDFGDAPDTYGTDDTAGNSSSSNDPLGASHIIIANLFLGATPPDEENNGFVDGNDDNGNATDDDATDDDDEGDLTLAAITQGDTSYAIPAGNIIATNTTGANATLHAWIDFNNNGTFEDTEHTSVAVNNATDAGNPVGDLIWNNINVGAAGNTYARFRLTTDGSIDSTTPGGIASDGEVEDYQIAIAPPASIPVNPTAACPANVFNLIEVKAVDRVNEPGSSPEFEVGHVSRFDYVAVMNGKTLDLLVEVVALNNQVAGANNSLRKPNGLAVQSSGSVKSDMYADDPSNDPVGTRRSYELKYTFVEEGTNNEVNTNFEVEIGDLDNYITGSQEARSEFIQFSNDQVDNFFLDPNTQLIARSINGGTVVEITNGTQTSSNPGDDPRRTVRFQFQNVSSFNIVYGGEKNSANQRIGNTGFGFLALDPMLLGGCDRYDHGDAPDSDNTTGSNNYQTLRANDGPAHKIVSGLYLGSSEPDADNDGTPTASADGDDNSASNTNFDDEDGIQLGGSSLQSQSLTPGDTITLDVATAGTGVLNAWMDWNGDGDFDDTVGGISEQIATDADVSGGTLDVTVPSGAIAGNTFARFRYSSDTGLLPTGIASDGEVEDYQVAIATFVANTISGTVFEDFGSGTTGNDIPELSENDLGNITINLYQDDGDGVFDATTDTLETTTTSNATDGTYSLGVNSDGKYFVVLDHLDNDAPDITTALPDRTIREVDIAGADASNEDFPYDSVGVSFAACPTDAFLFQTNPSDPYSLNLATGSAVQEGTDIGNRHVNAIGFNIANSFIYGSNNTDNDGTISRVDSNYAVTTLGPIVGLPTGNTYNTGDVGPDGRLYLKRGTNLYIVDVNPSSSTYLQLESLKLSAGALLTDWAFNPIDNQLYAVDNNNNNLYRFDPDTGNVEDLGNTGITPINTFGAQFYDASGFLYISSNQDGMIYRLDTRNPASIDPTATFFANGPTSGNNDGARCLNAPIPIDFGDAPESYGTSLASDGARHNMSSGTNLYLGSTAPDAETDGQASNAADGDGDDENDLTLPTLTAGDISYTIPADDITATGSGTLHAWVDFNKSGAFEAGEYQSVVVTNGTPANDLVWTGITAGSEGDTYARLRFTSDNLVDDNTTTNIDERALGIASDGEVEDYQIAIAQTTTPTVICPTGSSATGGGYATGGTGIYRDDIFWLDWNCGSVTQFDPGDIVQKAWTGPSGIEITAIISNITESLSSYNTGQWTRDRLDDLYSGVNPIGLRNDEDGKDPAYDVTFSMTLNGVPISTDIVTAEAEDTGGPSEFAQWTTDGTPWQPLDVSSGSRLTAAFSNGGQTIDMIDPYNDEGGTLIALTEDVSTVSVAMNAGGTEAIAFGIMIPFDYGDADGYPASGGHLARRTATGGSQPTTSTPVNSLTMANLVNDSPYLGSIGPDIDPAENSDRPTVDADGDDSNGLDDEDGIILAPLTEGDTEYTIPAGNIIANTSGTVTLHAWIDFNRDSEFGTGEYQSVTINNGNVSGDLTWSNLSNITAGATYARFRITTDSNINGSTPYGTAIDGEMEDYLVAIASAPLCPAAKADLWFANDESGSVSPAEFSNALDFLYQISDGFIYDDDTGMKAGITGWTELVNSIEIVMPITESFGDPGDTGLFTDSSISLNSNSAGIRELYSSKRNTSPGTRLDYATNYLADLITAGNGSRPDTPQVAIMLTDASSNFINNTNQGGFFAWIAEANVLRSTGAEIVLILIDEAADAYNNDFLSQSVIDNVLGANGKVITVPNYADAADSAKGYIEAASQAICDLSTPVASDPGLLLAKRITAINPGQPDETQFTGFVDDPNSTQDNNPLWPDSDENPNSNINLYLDGTLDGGAVKPGDEIEYTIYFLSNGAEAAREVNICDVIPDHLTFVKDGYGQEIGIALGFDPTVVQLTPNKYLSNLLNDDEGDFYGAGTAPPTGLCKKVDADNNLVTVDGSNNNNGTIIVKPADSLPPANSPGQPAGSYGFIRFRGRVK